MAFNINEHKEVTQLLQIEDSVLGVMKWGQSNSFPQTLKNLIEQSPNSRLAIDRTTEFYAGSGFEGSDLQIHPSGLTLGDAVEFAARELATFSGFAIHCNYNAQGKVSNFRPISLTDLRFKRLDEINMSNRIAYHYNFGLNSEIKKLIVDTPKAGNLKWLYRFSKDPRVAISQIEKSGGLKNYNGQVLYYSNAGHSLYPSPKLLPNINFVLADIENSILVRKETSTGFVNSYLLKTTMDADDPNLIALELAIAQAQGARGSGKTVVFSGLSEDEVSSTLLESLGEGSSGRNTTITSCKTGYELAREVITGAYQIPPLLAGERSAGFSSTELKDSYLIFNSVTQRGRNILSEKFTKILKNSVFASYVDEVKIKKLTLDEDEEDVTADNGGQSAEPETKTETN